jgi:hypothetical protein
VWWPIAKRSLTQRNGTGARCRSHPARTTFGAAPLDNLAKAASLSPIARSPASTVALRPPGRGPPWPAGCATPVSGLCPPTSSTPPVEQKKGADHGIDGKILFRDDPKASKAERIVIQFKGGKTGVKDVSNMHGVLDGENAAMGVLISIQAPTPDMLAETVSSGFCEHKTICGMGEGWSRLAATKQLKDAPLNRRDAIDAEAKPQPNRAKRLECVELAPAFGRAAPFESASKLVALQTLRVAVHPGNQSGIRLKLRQRYG